MFNYILNDIENIEKDKEEILDIWMSYDIVKTTLSKNSFNIDFFRDKFAIKVLNYAISVIRSKEALGDCPVIGVMLLLFKKKNIPLCDVFMICVHFKNALLHYSMEKGTLNKNTLSEFSTLVDYNFHGVIQEYVTMYYHDNQNKEHFNLDSKKGITREKISAEVISDKQTIQITTTTSASQYLGEVEVDKELIVELDEYENDALDTIDAQDLITQEALENSAVLFENYSKIINTLYEFEELSYTLTILSDLISHTEIETLDLDTQGFIQTYLKAIISDLQSWRMSIFITMEAEDIHYLDKTLLSSIAQLQMTLMPQDESAQEEEIEFF